MNEQAGAPVSRQFVEQIKSGLEHRGIRRREGATPDPEAEQVAARVGSPARQGDEPAKESDRGEKQKGRGSSRPATGGSSKTSPPRAQA